MPVVNYARKIQAPSPGEINRYASPCRVSTMYKHLGKPHFPLSSDCNTAKASDKVKSLLVTAKVANFSITGIKPFVYAIMDLMTLVKQHNPELYQALGTAGCLCVRYVRGSTETPSNHCAGTAIDFTVFNRTSGKYELDLPLDNNLVQVGMLELYKFIKLYGQMTGQWLFWGAGFSREDGMHVEASDELIQRWALNDWKGA